MAPARMVSFMEQHIESCDICQADPDLKEEVAKITELVLPESKIPKAVRQQNSKLKAEEEAEEEDETPEDENLDSNPDDIDDEEEEELNLHDEDSAL